MQSLAMTKAMQAVILAAGRGTRLQPFTDKTPKPLLKVGEKNLIEHNLHNLPNEVNEVIIVIGYLGEQIKKYFGRSFNEKKIRYIVQKELTGTDTALRLCRRYLQDRFLVLMADNIYTADDFKKCLSYSRSILAQKASGRFYQVCQDKNGFFQNLELTIHGGLMNAGLYVLDKNYFLFHPELVPFKAEYGLPQSLAKMAKQYPIKIVKTKKWIQINDHDDLKKAESILKKSSQ